MGYTNEFGIQSEYGSLLEAFTKECEKMGWEHNKTFTTNNKKVEAFSSLSMHPVEVFLYLGVAIWHVIIPSHPLIALYQLHYAGFGAIPGHIGFDKIELGEKRATETLYPSTDHEIDLWRRGGPILTCQEHEAHDAQDANDGD